MRIFVVLAASLFFAQAAFAEPVGSPIPVGIAVGQTTNVALFGEEQVNGAKVAEKMFNEKGGVNGTPIKLVFQDTGGDEAGAINAFQNLISRDKVVAIIGPTLSQQAFAANPIANQAKVPVVGPSNTAKGVAQIGEYVSRISAPMTLVAPNALKRALKVNPGVKNVAVVYAQEDAFNVSETGIFHEAIKGMGLNIAMVQKTSVKDTDFTTQVTAILGANVDMVVMSCLAADGGNMVKQLRQFGYEGIIVGGNGFNSPNMYPVCGKECTGGAELQHLEYERTAHDLSPVLHRKVRPGRPEHPVSPGALKHEFDQIIIGNLNLVVVTQEQETVPVEYCFAARKHCIVIQVCPQIG